MPVDSLQMVDIIEVMENFMEKVRPPVDIRSKLDIIYQIEGQSVVIYEARPRWNAPEEIGKHGVAKATFIKSRKSWKVYWQRADLKWHLYEPTAQVESLESFLSLLEKILMVAFGGEFYQMTSPAFK